MMVLHEDAFWPVFCIEIVGDESLDILTAKHRFSMTFERTETSNGKFVLEQNLVERAFEVFCSLSNGPRPIDLDVLSGQFESAFRGVAVDYKVNLLD